MPYIITTTRPVDTSAAHDDLVRQAMSAEPNPTVIDYAGREIVSRRAVATMDEAKNTIAVSVTDLARDHQPGWQSAFALTVGLPAQGGTVGPLPDGTTVTVEPVSYDDLVLGDGCGYPPQPDEEVDPETLAEVLEVYNAAQETTTV